MIPNLPYEAEFHDAILDSVWAMNIHANEHWPEEVCGLVLSNGDIIRLINQARSAHRFTVSRSQLAEKLASIDPDLATVVAIYHSHPRGTTTLSPTDVESMEKSWSDDGLTLPWVVIVPNSRVGVWWIDPRYRAPQSTIFHLNPDVIDLLKAAPAYAAT